MKSRVSASGWDHRARGFDGANGNGSFISAVVRVKRRRKGSDEVF